MPAVTPPAEALNPAKDIVTAFNYALREQMLPVDTALQAAHLMMELACLYQHLDLCERQQPPLSPQARADLATCRERIAEVSAQLQLNIRLP